MVHVRLNIAALAIVFFARPVTVSGQVLITTNKTASTASIIDLKTGTSLGTLPTGKSPHELAVSRDGKIAVVTDYGGRDNTLTVIDVASRKVVRTVSFAPHSRPHGAVFLPDNRTLVVTAESEGLLVLVDIIDGKVVGTRKTGSTLGHMVALSPDARTAFVANITPGNLSIIDLAGTAEPVVVPVGIQTEAIGLSPDGKLVWMGSNSTGKVFLVDVAARRVIDSVQTPGFPYRIGFTPGGKTALVTNPMSNELRIIDVATRKVRAVVDMLPSGVSASLPQGIAISPRGDKAWITLGTASSVAEVDIATGKVLRWLATDVGPDGVVFVQ